MDPSAVVKLVENNLWERLSYLARTRKDAVVQDTGDFLLVDSGLPSAIFNSISRSTLHPRFAMDRIEAAMKPFHTKKVPFTWWIGPNSGHGGMEPTLQGLGLTCAEDEWGMVLSLDTLNMPPNQAGGLDIKRAATKDQVTDFAKVVAGEPADENITKFYADTAEAVLSPTALPKFYVGYMDGAPVAAVEVFYAHGVAGFYTTATTAAGKGKGYLPALTIAALKDAKKLGQRLAALMATEAARPGYQRIGFKPIGKFAAYRSA